MSERHDRAILKERRRLWWASACSVAVGVFVGGAALLMMFLVGLDEGWFDWALA